MVFSGIVEEMGTVVSMVKVPEITLWDGSKGEGWLLKITANVVLDGCTDGCSIAVNGVCLTALPGWTNKNVTFGVSPETLRCTNLGLLREGSRVNLERSLRADSRNSGHYVQGHVDCVGTILKFTPEGDSLWVSIKVPENIISYIVRKGYIAVDGTSLTVCNVNASNCSFDLMLVAHTQQCVIMPHYPIGGEVNLEVDVMGKYAGKATEHMEIKVRELENRINMFVALFTAVTVGLASYNAYK